MTTKSRALNRISISDPANQADFPLMYRSISSATDPWIDDEMDLRQATVLFFYKELMMKVVDEYEELPRYTGADSDEEPVYDTNKVTHYDDLVMYTSRNFRTQTRKSGSKLRERIIASHSHGHMSKSNRSLHSTGLFSASQQSLFSPPVTPRRRSTMRKSHGWNGSLRPSFLGGTEITITDEEEEEDRDSHRRRSPSFACSLEAGDETADFFMQANTTIKRMQVKFTSGARYAGDMVYHRFHGVGVYTWPNGVRYEGAFTDGAVTGYGKIVYPDLSYYHGTFLNCILEGTGTFYPAGSSSAYSGTWSQGVPHGKGHLCYSEQDMYNGHFENGLKHGEGTRIYSNKAVYSGTWANGAPSGHGCMVFANRDYYDGQWHLGKPHGQGAYVWDARLCEGITCSIEKHYIGTFTNGQRDGYGVQMLGMEGSKIASQFDDNMKTGAGIVVCGDGTTIEKKPLFMMDNPVRSSTVGMMVEHSGVMKTPSALSISRRKMTSSKFVLRALRSTMQEGISDIDGVARSRIIETFPQVNTSGVPLSLPLHATAKDIKLDYHVKRLQVYNKADAAFPLKEEKRLLGRVIANNYVYLRKVYHKYATLNPLQSCCPDLRNPAMSRLRLCQFLRDINVCSFNVSLVDVERMLLDVPNIHLESEFDPFETIYFWQFMHCLLVLAFISHTLSPGESDGLATYQEIFRAFIQDVIRPNEGRFKGRALFVCRDLLPMLPLYKLYQSIGEPHSARDLFKRICHRKDEVSMHCNVKQRRIKHFKRSYKHFVLGGQTIFYLDVNQQEPWERPEPEPEDEAETQIPKDPFYTDLRVFRVLGPVKVMQCMTEACRSIMSDEDITFIDYEICFLEFYEILINLAEELSMMRKQEQEEVRRVTELRPGGSKSQDATAPRDSGKSATSKKKGRKGKRSK